ncbi:hypothetical protein EXT46_16695 [Pseudoalteromonas sp. CO325X]|uniref:hypothetical protein n=1 Tax=Pseudoalteromonas sp. CO325X TaxID=1777262 RepID=UPI001023068D|nr:hypothetical protein [Pseudoalteromonas sp. CO325X]RZF77762.1 hypothetical protein EXT46_16695 [Pseudoalteromonas sp. CO325X]
MKIFQEEPIFKTGFTYKEVAGLIVTVFFAIPVLILISNTLINKFLETISLLELTEKGEIFFFYETGQSLGFIFFIITISLFIFLALPVFINRRFSKKIIGWSSFIGALALLVGIITAPISSFLVESYIEEEGYSRCSYYSGSGYNPADYYVFDSKYCVSEISVLTHKALPWFEEMNKKGEVDYDEFLLKVEQWKAESPFFKDE